VTTKTYIVDEIGYLGVVASREPTS